MRTIKFRGKDIADEKWIYGSLVTDGYKYHIVGELETEAHEYNEVYKETVGQFTGLRDSLGKEIYEGDVLRRMEGKGNDEYKVVFEEWVGSYALVNVESPADVKELSKFIIGARMLMIIGNIHDNPELNKILWKQKK